MPNDLAVLPELKPNSISILGSPTPSEKIKRRPGAGGKMFDYVEIGYVVAQLDKAFNRLWEFEIIADGISNENNQVWVRGRLTVHLAPNFSLKKEAYGSSDIKRYAVGDNAKKVIDIGNDFKSASSDALKKAASLVGVAQDVYFPHER